MRFVDVTAKMVSSGTVRMERSRKTSESQGRLEKLWAEFESGELIEEFLLLARYFAPSSV